MLKYLLVLLFLFSCVSLEAGPNSGSVETYVVTIENYQGVNYQVGWYVDGSVLTVLDGKDEGKQIVVHDNKAVDTSKKYNVFSDHFIHYYNWGTVTSYSNRQILTID